MAQHFVKEDMSIYDQVYDALDNATHENGYDHEWELTPVDTALQIHDWSGIEGFDPNNSEQLGEAQDAVFDWRRKNPK